jgi:hypothetical protein
MSSAGANPQAKPGRQDLLRRFTPTPFVADLLVMARTIRVETNCRRVLQLAEEFFTQHRHGPQGDPDFLWRIVIESDPQMTLCEAQTSAFSDQGLRLINLGYRSFLAVDLDRREAIAFLGERFVHGDPRFHGRPPLDILFCLSAGGLGLTTLSAACVGMGETGVLLFGPPNSGKTTTSYLVAKQGAEFHADQAVFFESVAGKLRMWGDPLPAVFRPEGVRFLPELRDLARLSHYAQLTFYYLDKRSFQAKQVRPIVPLCSVFLDRGSSPEPHLTAIDASDLSSRLMESILFKDDDRFHPQQSTVCSGLGKVPAYHLKYGSDPAIAAAFVRNLLLDGGGRSYIESPLADGVASRLKLDAPSDASRRAD